MRPWFGITLIAVVITAAIPLIWGGQDAFMQLQRVPVGWLLMMSGIIFLGWNINAVRLKLLLGRRARLLGHSQALIATITTECAFSATPGGSGAPFTLISMLRRHRIRASEASAVFAVDQVMDLLFFLLALPLLVGYGVGRLIDAPNWVLTAAIIGQAALVFAATVAFRYHRASLRKSGRLLRILGVNPATGRRWARAQLAFSRAVYSTLRISPWRLILVFALCVVHWLLRYSILYLAVLALGQHLDWTYTFSVQMLSMAAGHLTFLPGGAGGTELTSAALLAPYLHAGTVGAAILIWRCMTYYLYLLAGGVTLATVTGWRLWQQALES